MKSINAATSSARPQRARLRGFCSLLPLLAFALAASGCLGSSSDAPAAGGPPQGSNNCATANVGAPTSNTVNGSGVSAPSAPSQQIYFYPKNGDASPDANIPMVDVTICPGSTYSSGNCATVPNILLDTGSYGLRVFRSAMTKYNSGISIPSSTTADCIEFGIGADWGSVVPAFVTLGGQTTTKAVSIQVIDPTFGNSSLCVAQSGTLDTSPAEAGYNGIMGVGPLISECADGEEGLSCADGSSSCNDPNRCDTPGGGVYFTCSGSSCSPVNVAQASQVSNPVAFLPAGYDNGIIVELPSVGSGGADGSSTTGYVQFGIPATSNSNLGVYNLNSFGEFATDFVGQTMSSILDTGSNGIFIPNSIANFALDSGSWAIPSSTVSCQGVNFANTGSADSYVGFQVANADQLFSGNNLVFNDIAGDSGAYFFDWGLPFFLGRNVYVGFDEESATINGNSQSGPFWSY